MQLESKYPTKGIIARALLHFSFNSKVLPLFKSHDSSWGMGVWEFLSYYKGWEILSMRRLKDTLRVLENKESGPLFPTALL